MELPIIVVGSHDVNGMRSPWSQTGNSLTVYALGEGISCASGQDPHLYIATLRGTSMGKLRYNQIFYLLN